MSLLKELKQKNVLWQQIKPIGKSRSTHENSPMVDQLEQKEFAEYVPVNEFLEDKER